MTLRSFLSRFRGEEGSVMVEFAIVVPLFLFLMFTVIDFARLGYSKVMAEKATQIAVRMSVVNLPACADVPAVTQRGVVGLLSLDIPNGTSCAARQNLCRAERTVSCTGSLSNPTVAQIWSRVKPLMPTGAGPQHLLFSYSYDANMNRVGAPYAPLVTVELSDLPFDYISPLGKLADLASGQSGSTLGSSFTFASMSASLPSEDLR
jgi:hypothetical protein